MEIVEQEIKSNDKLFLINHEKNQGVGGAVSSGIKWSSDNDIDIAVKMDGDGQMEPTDMPNLLDAIIEKGGDFAKGNRLLSSDVRQVMPKFRLFASQVLSLLNRL